MLNQGFLRKAIIEDWRKNDIKSKNSMNISDASKVKDQMKLNNLTAKRKKIQRNIDNANHAMQKTGISLSDLQGDEKPIGANWVKSISQEIEKNNLSESAIDVLNALKFTVERFKQVNMQK